VRVDRIRAGTGFDGARPDPPDAADWALLTLAAGGADGIPPLPLAEGLPAPGTAAALAGYGQDRAHGLLADRGCRVTGVGRREGTDFLVNDCSGPRGTSGAPLLAEREGRWAVLGVNVAAGTAGNLAIAATSFAEAARAAR
jgi:protease YdgD